MVERVFSGAPWEKQVGYCRALRAGDWIHVSGTAPVDASGATFAPGDPYRQTARCFEIALEALARLGATPAHVVRTRMFVTDASRWSEHGRAHAEVFAAHPPATTLVEVARLIDPEMTVEIELDAYLGREQEHP